MTTLLRPAGAAAPTVAAPPLAGVPLTLAGDSAAATLAGRQLAALGCIVTAAPTSEADGAGAVPSTVTPLPPRVPVGTQDRVLGAASPPVCRPAPPSRGPPS